MLYRAVLVLLILLVSSAVSVEEENTEQNVSKRSFASFKFRPQEENEVLIDKAKQVMRMIRTVLKQNSLSNRNVEDLRLKNQAKSRAKQLLNQRMGKYYNKRLPKSFGKGQGAEKSKLKSLFVTYFLNHHF